MKKVLAVLLTVAMLASVFCVNTSATETSVTKEKLGELIYDYDCYGTVWGRAGVSYLYSDVWIASKDVYRDKNSTEEDYQNALDLLKDDALNNVFVDYDYAEATYELALQEKNYNNWYSEEDWMEFQNKLSELKAVLDKSEGKDSSELSDA